mmetsp:Transcript_12690/g.32142  ORF Transcript_12690/g.32142 Transcript_12690/m.32142 type:complete len:333 (+) Transcript_12690:101-1099(+)
MISSNAWRITRSRHCQTVLRRRHSRGQRRRSRSKRSIPAFPARAFPPYISATVGPPLHAIRARAFFIISPSPILGGRDVPALDELRVLLLEQGLELGERLERRADRGRRLRVGVAPAVRTGRRRGRHARRRRRRSAWPGAVRVRVGQPERVRRHLTLGRGQRLTHRGEPLLLLPRLLGARAVDALAEALLVLVQQRVELLKLVGGRRGRQRHAVRTQLRGRGIGVIGRLCPASRVAWRVERSMAHVRRLGCRTRTDAALAASAANIEMVGVLLAASRMPSRARRSLCLRANGRNGLRPVLVGTLLERAARTRRQSGLARRQQLVEVEHALRH